MGQDVGGAAGQIRPSTGLVQLPGAGKKLHFLIVKS
jgi:hypothetical protein